MGAWWHLLTVSISINPLQNGCQYRIATSLSFLKCHVKECCLSKPLLPLVITLERDPINLLSGLTTPSKFHYIFEYHSNSEAGVVQTVVTHCLEAQK